MLHVDSVSFLQSSVYHTQYSVCRPSCYNSVVYHFHALLQREEKVYKCHIALLSVLRNALTRNGGTKYTPPRREYILLPPFLVTGFQPFQLVRAFQAILHWPATN